MEEDVLDEERRARLGVGAGGEIENAGIHFGVPIALRRFDATALITTRIQSVITSVKSGARPRRCRGSQPEVEVQSATISAVDQPAASIDRGVDQSPAGVGPVRSRGPAGAAPVRTGPTLLRNPSILEEAASPASTIFLFPFPHNYRTQ